MSDTTRGNEPDEAPRDDTFEASSTEQTPAEPEVVETVVVDEVVVDDTAAGPVVVEESAVSSTGTVRDPLAEAVERHAYVSPSTIAPIASPEPEAAPAAAPVAEPVTTYPAYTATPQQAIYVQAPVPPKAKGNRAFGVVVGLVASVVFAALYALAAYVVMSLRGTTNPIEQAFAEFVGQPVFWVPIIFFFLAFILLAAIVNRGGWWPYAIFGLLVGAVVYLSYVGGALLSVAWRITPDDVSIFVSQQWLAPLAILAGVFAREVTVWFGAWVASRGRKVSQRNREALEEYDRQLAAGPQFSA
ncbi:hypothetical protein [Agromyces atrinae]|uniref:Uncharacterized protein n=1 Tax=Agromyces atrinae TaxID=592376 RepID=A0A4Q2MC01_9MICO|nr:hypothetical protein [Agromyces atrinae]NYD66895.1 hypothetical protein [Agromyces atrinae]RXZ87542.1 hypothetical protein ESP50_06405 [Agromyces atrinae]